MNDRHPDFWITASLSSRKEAVMSDLGKEEGIALSPLTNVAAGYGEAVLALAGDGMLTREPSSPPGFSLYSLTSKGRVTHGILKSAES